MGVKSQEITDIERSKVMQEGEKQDFELDMGLIQQPVYLREDGVM